MTEKLSIANILDIAIGMGASDVHLSHNIYPYFRVYGDLGPIDIFPKVTEEGMNSLLEELLVEEKLKTFEEEKQVDAAYTYKDVRIRIHGYYQRGSKSLSLRIIPKDIPKFESLNLPDSIKDFISIRNGLVIVTGITGSGKSTTLASIIDKINTNQRKRILTIEDPIEYIHVNKLSMVEQREVGNDVPSFRDATKAALRADPDIILVGELREIDTVSNALTLAETGHLVFGTLHTKSAAESADRIVDLFPAEQQGQIRSQIANNLRGVISQELIRSSNGKLVPLVEVLKNNTAIANSIKESNISNIKDQMLMNKGEGMITRALSALSLVEQGKCEIKDIEKYLSKEDYEDFKELMKNR